MADEAFRTGQVERRYEPHVRPINELVDELRARPQGWLPYVAPAHGGVGAPILSVLRDPGPATRDGAGSGLLSIENDDPTAQAQAEMIESVGLTARDLTPWNAYPWYINAKPTTAQLVEGLGPLVSLINLMPALKVVLLQGRDAQESWRRLEKHHPKVAQRVPLVVRTFHPGRQALFSADPAVRQARREHRQQAFEQAAQAAMR